MNETRLVNDAKYPTCGKRGRSLSSGGHHRREGRATATGLLVFVGLAVAAAGGHWVPKWLSSDGTSLGALGAAESGDSATGNDEQWYTCGMHPNVLQKGPGDCPICQMKLTPRKPDEENGGSDGGPQQRKILYWRAPMDPNFLSDRPGKSPMGMDLVPVYADEDESPSAHNIRIDPVTIQNMGIRTTAVRRGPLIKTIRTVGRVDYDEQLVTFVDTKFNGWIEALYIDETGMPVANGERLFDVYSPELYAAQEEYLAAIRNLPRMEKSTFPGAREEAAKLIDVAVTKLKYLDVSDAQIDRMRETDQIEKTLTIHSPAKGIVTEKMVLDGMYVKPGMRLYTIADLSRVWVYVDIYEYQLPWIRVGQAATMTLPYIPGREFVGKVVYIYPYLEQMTRVIKVRLEFENTDMELKPGMYANVKLESQLQRDALLVPREAYIDSGTRQVLFVDLGNGKFAPRDIQVGVEAENGMVEVLHGIDEGEVVVTSGQFMLDAESKLKEAVAKMMEAERAKTTKRTPQSESQTAASHADDAASMTTEALAATLPDDAAFACPMEHHPDAPEPADRGAYFSAEPGDCPRCGMRLKPLEELPWPATYGSEGDEATAMVGRSDGEIPGDAEYGCPMDEHPDETDPAKQGPYFAGQPGKCPLCGMKLQPLDELEWVRVRRAAKGGDVAYTCADHQHVFSDKHAECPRCGKTLMPFKVMYTCPDSKHAGVISTFSGNCPQDGQGLAAFRGVWLDETMAEKNLPADPGLAEVARYRCPVHPLVHSDGEGSCTICGLQLESMATAGVQPEELEIPADAKYTCSMKECWYFAENEGECPVCGMYLKPIEEVAWAQEMLASRPSSRAEEQYVCPMHPQQVRGPQPGTCSVCGMQLVNEKAFKLPRDAPTQVAAQVDYIMEHYLELQRLLASDRTTDIARHALGLASASEELAKHIDDAVAKLPPEARAAADRLHAAALKITGASLIADRVTFVELSAAVRTLVEQARPDRKRWPKLYIYHCPMSKGDWIQATREKANPYYGFKMLTCGELQGVE